MSGARGIKTLVLTMQYPHKASYYDDWLDAFSRHAAFNCEIRNILKIQSHVLARVVDEFDAVVLLHSCTADTVEYLGALAPALAGRKRSRLFAFVGNEYNSAVAPLADKISVLRACRPDFVATQLLAEVGDYLYNETGAVTLSVPHALNPEAFPKGPPHAERRIDIGVRSFRYPASLGDNDRNRLIDYFVTHGAATGLSLDISQTARFGRDEWSQFLGTCRGTISTEAGTWYIDRDDALATRVHDYLSANRTGLVIPNHGPLRRMARLLPVGVKERLTRALRSKYVSFEGFENEPGSFDEIYDLFFRGVPRAPVYSKGISSRHFDAIGTGTCQIMLPGRYNDILVAGEHYLALDDDFGNFDDVIRQFRDHGIREAIVERAYNHVLSGHTYEHRIARVADVLAS